MSNLTKEELNMIFQEEVDKLGKEIDEWALSTVVNTEKVTGLKKVLKVQCNFFAKMTCGVCGHEHHINRMEDAQYENCKMAKSAQLLNAVVGFGLNAEKINELKQAYQKTPDENVRKDIATQIANEENFYHIKFLCNSCALYFQNEFNRIFVARQKEIGAKIFI